MWVSAKVMWLSAKVMSSQGHILSCSGQLKRMWMKGGSVEKSLEKWGLWATAGGEGRWQAPRGVDSNMQLSRVKLNSAEQSSWQKGTVKVDRLKLSIAEQSYRQQYALCSWPNHHIAQQSKALLSRTVHLTAICLAAQKTSANNRWKQAAICSPSKYSIDQQSKA